MSQVGLEAHDGGARNDNDGPDRSSDRSCAPHWCWRARRTCGQAPALDEETSGQATTGTVAGTPSGVGLATAVAPARASTPATATGPLSADTCSSAVGTTASDRQNPGHADFRTADCRASRERAAHPIGDAPPGGEDTDTDADATQRADFDETDRASLLMVPKTSFCEAYGAVSMQPNSPSRLSRFSPGPE